MNRRASTIFLLHITAIFLCGLAAGPACLAGAGDPSTAEIIPLTYRFGTPFEQRVNDYYVPMGAERSFIHDHVLPPLSGPMLSFMDDFPNAVANAIAEGCSEESDDLFDQLACISASIHAWIGENHEYDDVGRGEDEKIRSYCRDHARAIQEVARRLPKINRYSIGFVMLTTHILNKVTVTTPDGAKYSYAFDAGHDVFSLRFYPLNDAAQELGAGIVDLLPPNG